MSETKAYSRAIESGSASVGARWVEAKKSGVGRWQLFFTTPTGKSIRLKGLRRKASFDEAREWVDKFANRVNR